MAFPYNIMYVGGVLRNINPHPVIRHSAPGMPYGFVRILFFSCFLFFRRQDFRMITFDRQTGPFLNFCRSQVMVIGRSV